MQYITIIIQLIIAIILGGIVGMEREGLKRPAGFRTHILVCVAATIAMQVNIHLHATFSATTNMDPSRLGAQVISGLGFLGAGTIIREGASVKGLTTAASLWAIGIIGLAIGSSFYLPAVIGTMGIYISLELFQKIEHTIRIKKGHNTLSIIAEDTLGLLSSIGREMSTLNISICSIETAKYKNSQILITLDVQRPRDIDIQKAIIKLSEISGVRSVTQV